MDSLKKLLDWMYIERWLKAPVQLPDGTLEKRGRGMPQGAVISPLLANLFLVRCMMQRHCSSIPFERYADDIICHCKSEAQARWLKRALKQRLAECGLQMHPENTKIVYCKDSDRKGNYPNESFDFLRYTFHPRRSKNRWGKPFINFSPAVSNRAEKSIRQTIKSWKLRCRVDKDIDNLVRMFNPVIRGCINYYGCNYKSALYPTLRYLDGQLVRWVMAKYKRKYGDRRRTRPWLNRVARSQPGLFAHWCVPVCDGWMIRAG